MVASAPNEAWDISTNQPNQNPGQWTNKFLLIGPRFRACSRKPLLGFTSNCSWLRAIISRLATDGWLVGWLPPKKFVSKTFEHKIHPPPIYPTTVPPSPPPGTQMVIREERNYSRARRCGCGRGRFGPAWEWAGSILRENIWRPCGRMLLDQMCACVVLDKRTTRNNQISALHEPPSAIRKLVHFTTSVATTQQNI